MRSPLCIRKPGQFELGETQLEALIFFFFLEHPNCLAPHASLTVNVHRLHMYSSSEKKR